MKPHLIGRVLYGQEESGYYSGGQSKREFQNWKSEHHPEETLGLSLVELQDLEPAAAAAEKWI